MADDQDHDQDKTEAPSQRRLEDAKAEGDLPRSPEITILAVLGGFALIVIYMPTIGIPSFSDLSRFLAHADGLHQGTMFLPFFLGEVLRILGSALALVFSITIGAALAAGGVQSRFVVTLSAIAPKWSNISPLSGLKRIFGIETLVQFVKALLKLGIVGAVLAFLIAEQSKSLFLLVDLDLFSLMQRARDGAITMIFAVLGLQAVIAGGDFLYRWFSWHQKLRMTRHDLKEEFKQQEGQAEIKQKLKQKRREMAKGSMMRNVPKATVIVTNPTHFAVALRYDTGMRAPVCLAKGVDVLALRIRTIGQDHRVPIIEDPPLARSLYRLVDVDEEIPLDLYKPVAEIIGYVMRLKRGHRGRYRAGQGRA